MSTSTPASPVRPLLWLLTGSICISFAPIFIRLADVSPDSAGFYRMLFAGLSLLLLLKLKGASLFMQRRTLLLLVCSGIFLSIDFMCWHRSIHYVGPGLATLIGNFQIFFTAIFSCLFFREKIRRVFIVAVLMALVGMFFITGVDLGALDQSYRLGILFGIGTAIFYSGYILLLKSAMNHQAVSGVSAMFVISVTCTVFFGIITPVTGSSFMIPDSISLWALVAAGVVCTTIGWSLISTAIKHTTATITSLFLLLQPALAFVWDVLFFSRATEGREAFGVLLILSAIYVGSYRR
jgi:drug/metabolite transporter (DMT)-like permease